MSPITVAGDAIATALRHLAMFAIWLILVVAVVAAIVAGLSDLRQRQETGSRDQAADRQATARPALTRTVVSGAPRTQPVAAYPSTGSDRDESAADDSGIPVGAGTRTVPP